MKKWRRLLHLWDPPIEVSDLEGELTDWCMHPEATLMGDETLANCMEQLLATDVAETFGPSPSNWVAGV